GEAVVIGPATGGIHRRHAGGPELDVADVRDRGVEVLGLYRIGGRVGERAADQGDGRAGEGERAAEAGVRSHRVAADDIEVPGAAVAEPSIIGIEDVEAADPVVLPQVDGDVGVRRAA